MQNFKQAKDEIENNVTMHVMEMGIEDVLEEENSKYFDRGKNVKIAWKALPLKSKQRLKSNYFTNKLTEGRIDKLMYKFKKNGILTEPTV